MLPTRMRKLELLIRPGQDSRKRSFNLYANVLANELTGQMSPSNTQLNKLLRFLFTQLILQLTNKQFDMEFCNFIFSSFVTKIE